MERPSCDMTDQQMQRCIRTLAREACANYRYGYCLETDDRCYVLNPAYETVHDGTVNCDYFLSCVLPADWSLNDLVAYAMWYDEDSDDEGLPARMKRCAMCREPFNVTNNRQRYCPTCAGIVSRQQAAIRKRKSRSLRREAQFQP